jgi:hypothetical protein
VPPDSWHELQETKNLCMIPAAFRVSPEFRASAAFLMILAGAQLAIAFPSEHCF